MEEEDVLKEAFFAPSDGEMLPAMFEAFSRAAEMNPEPGDHDHDDEHGDASGGPEEGVVLDHGRYVHSFSGCDCLGLHVREFLH